MTACTVLQCSSMSFSKELSDDMTLSPDFFLSFLGISGSQICSKRNRSFSKYLGETGVSWYTGQVDTLVITRFLFGLGL